MFDRKIANLIGAPAVVDATDRAPSLLNGGLGKISPIYWAVVLAGAAAIDVYGISRSKSNDPSYFPGNLGFDPIGLYPKDGSFDGWDGDHFSRTVLWFGKGLLV